MDTYFSRPRFACFEKMVIHDVRIKKMKFKIKPEELTRRKHHTLKVMAGALLTALIFIFIAMHDDIVRFLIVGGATTLMSAFACLSGSNSMLCALRDHGLDITDAGIQIPVQRGVSLIPYDRTGRGQTDRETGSRRRSRILQSPRVLAERMARAPDWRRAPNHW